MPKNCPTCGAKVEPEIDLPDWLPRPQWAEWVAVRKETRHPLTPTIIKAQIRQLDKWRQAGHSVADILEYSTTGGYQGLFEPKGSKTNGASQVGQSPDEDYMPAPVEMSKEDHEDMLRRFPHLAGGVH